MARRYVKKSSGRRYSKRSGYSRSNKRGGSKRGGGRRGGGNQTIRIVVEQPQALDLPFSPSGRLQSETPSKKSKF